MKRKHNHNFGNWMWTVEDGQVEKWSNLTDRHLANVYGFFRSKDELEDRYKSALNWVKKEAKRRGALRLLNNIDSYGCYPYKNRGNWEVFDKKEKRIVPLKDYDWSLLPPDIRNEFEVIEMLIGI